MNEFFFSNLGLIFKDYLKFVRLHILLLTIFVKNLFHKKRVCHTGLNGGIPFYARAPLCLLNADMFFDGFKADGTNDMFDAAGILQSGVRGDAQRYKPVGQDLMPFVDHIGNGHAAVSQINIAFGSYSNVVLFTQVFHGDTDTGLFEPKFFSNIH